MEWNFLTQVNVCIVIPSLSLVIGYWLLVIGYWSTVKTTDN
jgi:hypothetical protein